METLTSVSRSSRIRHTRICIDTTEATAFVDLTDRLAAWLSQSGIRHGLVIVQSLHTTAGVIVNEHEPLLLDDFRELLRGIAPERLRYQHDDLEVRTVNLADAERVNGHAHCRALLLPSSVSLGVLDGRLVLGRWQRVFLIDLDGPRSRDLAVTAVGGEAE